MGLFTGENGLTSIRGDVNAGAYTAEGEASFGGTIGPFSLDGTIGGSVGSAHIGGTISATYNNESNSIVIEGFEHIGFGVGEEVGGTFTINFNYFKNSKKE